MFKQIKSFLSFPFSSSDSNQVSLPLISEGVFDNDVPEHVDKRLVKYLKETFQKVECINYREGNKKNICECGKNENDHNEDLKAGNQPIFSTPYPDPNYIHLPSNAFGEINFGGRNTSKFIKLSDQTESSNIVDLMKNFWNLERPNLLISVTGGAQNFIMKSRLKEVFRRGFIKAAQTTGAWIITGGMNAGVMKHIGEAIREYTLRHGSKNVINTIGIASWGCVLNRNNLEGENGKWPANYSSVTFNMTKECPLDPNHTHFILVDNGTSLKYGVEIQLRTELERCISNSPFYSNMETFDTISIPIVCVVLEGGPNTIDTLKNAISCGTPAIVVQESGRAADVLAFAFLNSVEEEIVAEDSFGNKQKQLISIIDEELEKEIKEKIKTEMKIDDQNKINKCFENIKLCVRNRDFMTVFKLDAKGNASDIDITILHSLLKANKGKRIDQLKLALAWDRADVAKEQIFTDDAEFEPSDLYDLMYSALIQNKIDFVKLLISKGVSLKEFATIGRVVHLFNEQLTKKNCKHLRRFAGESLISLGHVGDFIQSLVGNYFEPTLSQSPWRDIDPRDFMCPQSQRTQKSHSLLTFKIPFSISHDKKVSDNLPEFEDSASLLFLWCVLVRMKQMSLVFWDIGREDIAASLLAQHISMALYSKDQDSEFAMEFYNQSIFFGELAVGVLNECYQNDQTRSTLLLVRQMSSYGDTTVLKMAVEADNKEFVAHPSCQNLLSSIWMDRISDDNNYIRLIVCLLMPLLAPFLLKFKQREKWKASLKYSTKKFDKKISKKKHRISDSPSFEDPDKIKKSADSLITEENFCIRYGRQLKAFLKTPFTTFCYNCIGFFFFLLFYGLILLTDFYPVASSISFSSSSIANLNSTLPAGECILIIWITTLLVEEIRQFILTEASSFRRKVWKYITDLWNFADCIAIFTFYIGLVLRLIPPSVCLKCFYWARIILAFNLMMFFMRVLHMFSVHQQLGPKLVMIKQMMIDLFYFVIIIMVFITSYGITSQVILFPNQPLKVSLLRDVLSDAWWNVYGEMSIDLVSGDQCSETSEWENPETCTLAKNITCPAETCAIFGYESDKCFGKKENCVANSWIVPILLAIYALITNVMMLNLLIAMFSNTFAMIQGQTNIVWKMQRYHLIQEFESRPMLPPPFIVFGHIYQLIRFFCCKQFCFFVKKTSSRLGFKIKLNKIEEKELKNWENIYAEEFLLRNESSGETTVEFQVQETYKRADDIIFKLDQLSESPLLAGSGGSGGLRLAPMLEKRFAFMEDKMKETSQILSLLMGHLHLKSPEDKEEKIEEKKKEDVKIKKNIELERFEKELLQHIHSRASIYPTDDIKTIVKYPVPNNKVDFKISYKLYRPSEYTSNEVLQGKYDTENPENIDSFNKFDKKTFDRKSKITERYNVEIGYPLNPRGRTGLRGRGILRRWGPNPMQKYVITRWSSSYCKKTYPSKALSQLEFLGVSAPDQSLKKSIPELLYPLNSDNVLSCLAVYFDTEIVLNSLLREWFLDKRSNSKTVFEDFCYFDDPRNTDNSWIEYCCFNYHDNDKEFLIDRNFNFSCEDSPHVSWVKINNKNEIYPPDLIILKRVADNLKAPF